MIPTTLGVALVVFSLYHIAPGDPATVMMGGPGGEMGQGSDVQAKIDGFRRKHGLDRSLAVQFFNYVGPFNLMRDGHPWFSTPYTERKTEEVELADGTLVREGVPLPLEYPPGVSLERGDELDALVAAFVDPDGDEASWSAARQELVAAGDEALTGLLAAYDSLRLDLVRGKAAIARVSDLLTELTGYEPQPHAERVAETGDLALIRHWFAWYYANGGYRVRNSGQEPWGGLLCLDLGDEMQKKLPVASELWKRLKVTVPLSLISVILSYLIALPMGIYSVRRQGTKADAFSTLLLFILYSIPTFWAGLMLIQVFGGAGLDWLPVIGLHDKDAAEFTPTEYFIDLVKHSILPIVTMTYVTLAYLSRQMRSGMLEVIRQDYIRTARAKGVSERVVIYKHALRNSLIPVITLFATVLPILVGGSIIVEKVFDIPGMGKYAFEGLLRRDFYIVMATTIFVGIMTQFGILLSDLTYSLVDPRIRHD